MKKNDIITVEITGITNSGSGVGRYEGMAVFVPYTAVGDVVECRVEKVKAAYAYARTVNMLTAANSRITPDCKAFGRCGGCAFRHFSYDEELSAKQKFVEDAFRRIGGLEPEFEQIIGGKTERYRNKGQFPIAEAEGEPFCGFYAPRSHRVVRVEDCRLQPEVFSAIIKKTLEYIKTSGLSVYNEITGKGLLRHIYLRRGEHTGEVMLCLVAAKDISSRLDDFCSMMTSSFPEIKSIVLNINPDRTNVILGSRCVTVFGSGSITDIMCGNRIRISPLSFYQVNTLQAEKLYAKAIEYSAAKSGDVVADLYCGAGTIGLAVARAAAGVKVVGVEIVEQAVENARENVRLNGIGNAEFYCGDAGEVFSQLREKGCAPDVIVVDPPRKGCSEQTIEVIARAAPKRIVMVSCDPATAARDSKRLSELGYKAEKVCPVDMFPRTSHVECVVGLACRRS